MPRSPLFKRESERQRRQKYKELVPIVPMVMGDLSAIVDREAPTQGIVLEQ